MANMNIIRLVMDLVTQCKWPVFQMDVKRTFLNDDLSKEVYLEQPLNYKEHGKEHLVCHLKKALYGLK